MRCLLILGIITASIASMSHGQEVRRAVMLSAPQIRDQRQIDDHAAQILSNQKRADEFREARYAQNQATLEPAIRKVADAYSILMNSSAYHDLVLAKQALANAMKNSGDLDLIKRDEGAVALAEKGTVPYEDTLSRARHEYQTLRASLEN